MCLWCSYHISTSSVIYYWTDAQQHGIYLFYIITKQTTTDKTFYFKIFQHNSKAGLCPLWRTRKKPFDVIYCLYKMKQSHWFVMHSKELWLVQENHATVKLDSSVASRGMKTYSESRIELRNLQILKKMLEKWSQFLSSEQSREAKSLELPWIFQKLKNTLGKRAVAVNLETIRFEFWVKSALVTVEICVLCGWWFSNQFEIVSEIPFSCNTVDRELQWARCCALKQTASESKVMCLV